MNSAITNPSFTLEVDYLKGSSNPSRVFRSMSDLIQTFQKMDSHLVNIIDSQIEPLLMLEDIEAGSLRTVLLIILNRIPDDAVYNLDWKPIVGQYLLKAKHIIIKFTEGKTTITDLKQLEPLTAGLDKLADEAKLKMLPAYNKIQPRLLMTDMNQIADSLSPLTKDDSVKYIAGGETSMFNLDFQITPEKIEDLVSKTKTTSEGIMILKVKKPDFLGDSRWELKHGTKTSEYTMLDKDWVSEYHNRHVTLQPQDSIRAIVREERKYDYDNELIAEHYSVIKVEEVIPNPQTEF